jgi:hypothetical protein
LLGEELGVLVGSSLGLVVGDVEGLEVGARVVEATTTEPSAGSWLQKFIITK